MKVIGLVVLLVSIGCVTTFRGAPKVENGPSGCKSTCERWSMELSGMVALGEYSDGCICQVPGKAATASAAAAGPAVIGAMQQQTK